MIVGDAKSSFALFMENVAIITVAISAK